MVLIIKYYPNFVFKEIIDKGKVDEVIINLQDNINAIKSKYDKIDPLHEIICTELDGDNADPDLPPIVSKVSGNRYVL
jgi:hypothetical protein